MFHKNVASLIIVLGDGLDKIVILMKEEFLLKDVQLKQKIHTHTKIENIIKNNKLYIYI